MAIKYSPRSYKQLVNYIAKRGKLSAPRGMATTELINAQLTVNNPIDRVVTDKARRMNFGFAVAEVVSFFTGVDAIQFFTAHIKDYDKYSSDGHTLDNSYGSRINANGQNQILGVIDKLKKDPDSRQAVLSLYDGKIDLFNESNHIPCTLLMVFRILNNKLVATTDMRSNDVIKGLTYDLFVFTIVQEYIARSLDVEMGVYQHLAHSLHLYASDNELIERLGKDSRWPFVMNKMPKFAFSEWNIARDAMLKVNDPAFDYDALITTVNPWLQDLLNGARAFVQRNISAEQSSTAYWKITDRTIKRVIRHVLEEKGILKPWGDDQHGD